MYLLLYIEILITVEAMILISCSGSMKSGKKTEGKRSEITTLGSRESEVESYLSGSDLI